MWKGSQVVGSKVVVGVFEALLGVPIELEGILT